MPSPALPSGSSPSLPVALTKVALRLVKLGDVADAIGDLTGLRRMRIEKLMRKVEKELEGHAPEEFTAVSTADRRWAEDVVVRMYQSAAAQPSRQIMNESLIGVESLTQFARDAMTAEDRREVDAAADNASAYLEAVSTAIAALIVQWYSTDQEANRAATSQVAGETLHIVRQLPGIIQSVAESLGHALTQAPGLSAAERGDVEPQHVKVVFELDLTFAPIATEDELSALVQSASVATIDGTPLIVEVSLPSLKAAAEGSEDTISVAQFTRDMMSRAMRRQRALTALFSPQVEAAWATYFAGLADRVTVVRAILAGPQHVGTVLKIWRTSPPEVFTSIHLSDDEVSDVLDSVQLGEWAYLRQGAGWRAADELPRTVTVNKAMASILDAVTRADAMGSDDVLRLSGWHISAD